MKEEPKEGRVVWVPPGERLPWTEALKTAFSSRGSELGGTSAWTGSRSQTGPGEHTWADLADSAGCVPDRTINRVSRKGKSHAGFGFPGV